MRSHYVRHGGRRPDATEVVCDGALIRLLVNQNKKKCSYISVNIKSYMSVFSGSVGSGVLPGKALPRYSKS